jgi:hypothetical protein
MDPRMQELVLLTTLACVCVGVASALDQWMLALVFAAEAALAGIEGARLNS